MRVCSKIVVLLATLITLYGIVLWKTQFRYYIEQTVQTEFVVTKAITLADVQSTASNKKLSLFHLNTFLHDKVILIDPRLLSSSKEKYKIHIGEENFIENLNNSILMAFFEEDRSEILDCLRKYELKWEELDHSNFRVSVDGESYHLIKFSISDTYDYYRFTLLNVTRIIPRFNLLRYNTSLGTFNVPHNESIFKWYLRHSKFVSCLTDYAAQYRNAYPELFKETPLLPNSIILKLRKFRDWAIVHGTTPMLFSGTLLGWYRECGIITYTHDIDFVLFSEEYYDGFANDIRETSFMTLQIRFNKPEDLLEFKVKIDNKYPMDIFFMYHNENVSWVGGLNYYQKYRYYYPLIDRACATDFLGYLMYVPCQPLDIIESDHGENWTKPLLESEYLWYKSPHNIHLVPMLNESEKEDIFVQYADD